MNRADARILIIEDNPGVSLVWRLMLQKNGFTPDNIRIIDTHEEAQHALENGQWSLKDFDIILNDLDTGSAINGEQFARTIHNQPGAPRVIMATSHGRDAQRLVEEGIAAARVDKDGSAQHKIEVIDGVLKSLNPTPAIDATTADAAERDKGGRAV